MKTTLFKLPWLALAACVLPLGQTAAAFAAKKESPPLQQATITSDPAGASVTIDKVQVGTTPFSTSLAPGRHLVMVGHKDYEPAYRTLELGAVPVVEHFKLLPVTSAVLILSDPPGATVTRDGANAGVTPLLLPEVPIGRYRIDIALTGYKPQQVELNVSGNMPQRIDAKLVGSSATLDITSAPEGASVTVNGVYRGVTPLKVDKIQEGQSFLEVAAEGYAPYREQLQLSAGEVFAVHAPLSALPSKLSIVSIPEGARVYVDNEFKGETPLELDGIPAGSYRIRVEKEGFDIMARTIEIGNNKSVTEEFRMAPNVGGVRIVTSPADVSVFVAGKLVGKTTAGTNATDQISEPLEIRGLPIGETEIVFQRQGYAEVRRKATISRDEMAVVETAKLPRLFVPDVEVRTEIGTYTGVYISKNAEYYRVETSPGVIRSFPTKDIVRIRLIRAGNIVEDNAE